VYGYLWTTIDGSIISGGNTANPTVSEAALYTVEVTNLSNGCTTTEDVEVFVDPATPSDAVLNIRDVSCFGDTDGSLVINSIVGGTPPFRYNFDNQGFTSNPLYTGLEPDVYDLVVQDANGCEYMTTVTIGEPAELLVDLGPDTVIVYGDYLSLVLDSSVVNYPERIEVTRINPQNLLDSLAQGSFRPLTSFRYTVTVIDSNGCEATDTRLVIVEKPRNVYIPNIFNPQSNDGNNLFMIFGDDKVQNIRVFQVFDRWGGAIHEYRNFKPNDTASGWDGSIRGQQGNPAVFTYYAEIEFIDGEVILYKGDVTLIRE
jgi:gliding motility-associated-like protein